MKLALGYCMSMKELFEKFPYKKLDMTCKEASKIAGDGHRDDAVYKIFGDSLDLILNDIIDNNITFELPKIGRGKADMHVEKFDGEDFKRIRRRGVIFEDVDFLKSVFSGNQLVLNIHTPTHSRRKTIYVSKYLQEKINKYTNEGKQYC